MLSRFLKVDEYIARGTTLITILPAILIASIIYSNNNYFDLNNSFLILIGGGIGGFIGAKIMHKISKFWLKLIFDIFLIGISLKNLIWG